MGNRHRFFFPTVLLLSSIGYFATDIYLPSFLAIQEDFQAAKASVQLSLSLYLVGWALSQLFYGPLSDRSGRKRPALLSLLIGFLGTFVCLASPNITSLILGRILQGLGLGGTAVLFRAILRDVYSGDQLAHYGSFVAVATAVFIAIAPAFGGYLQHFSGWRSCFLFLLFYLVGLFWAVFRFLPETNQHLNPLALQKEVLFKNYLHIIKSPIFLGYAGVSGLILGGFSAYLTSSPFLFEKILRLTPVQYGWLAWVIGLGFGLGGLCNMLLIKKIGRHRSLVVGIALVFFSGSLMLILSLFHFLNTPAIMFPMGVFSLGAAISFGNAFAGGLLPFSKTAGASGALFGCIQAFGGSTGSAIMSIIHEQTQTPLAIVLMVVGALAYICQYWAFSHAKKHLESPH